MRHKILLFLLLSLIGNSSYAYLDFFGSESGFFVGIDGGYQPNLSAKIGWGSWDGNILYSLALENESHYSKVYLDVRGKIPSAVSSKEWYQKLREYPAIFYQLTRLSFFANSFDYIPISGGIFLYGNSFHNLAKEKIFFSNDMFEVGFGVSLELGYTFIESVKIFVGAEYMPNWLSFGSKFNKNKYYEVNTGYEINSGIRYRVTDTITLNAIWQWGRIKVDNFLHYSEKIKRIKTVEATIYNNLTLGIEYRFF